MNAEQHDAAARRADSGWFRGGCHTCTWLGPYRKRRGDAIRDARQHTLDVRMYPDPTTPHPARDD